MRLRRHRFAIGLTDGHLQWYGEAEGGALADLTGRADLTIHGFDQSLADGQPEPRPAETSRRALVSLGEGGEDCGEFVRCNADTGILDGDPQPRAHAVSTGNTD